MVSPFSTDDTTMHKNMESRAPAGRRPAAILWVLSAATLIALAPLAARADDDDHHHRYKRGEYKSTGTAPVGRAQMEAQRRLQRKTQVPG